MPPSEDDDAELSLLADAAEAAVGKPGSPVEQVPSAGVLAFSAIPADNRLVVEREVQRGRLALSRSRPYPANGRPPTVDDARSLDVGRHRVEFERVRDTQQKVGGGGGGQQLHADFEPTDQMRRMITVGSRVWDLECDWDLECGAAMFSEMAHPGAFLLC